MTVAYHSSSTHVGDFTTSVSWLHAGAVDCRGVLVLAAQNGTTAGEDVTAVTYGGVALSQTPSSPLLGDAGTENGKFSTWFLGTGVPDGIQTVEITATGTDVKKAAVVAYTAAGDTEVVDDNTVNVNAANPSIPLTFTGRTAYAVAGIHFGGNTVTGVAPNAGFTDIEEYDFGVQGALFIRENANATDSSTPGWTVSTEEAHGIGVAVAEVAAGGQTVAPTGFAVLTALGGPSATVTADAAPAGLPVGVSLGSPSAPFTASASPAGLAVPTAVGTPSAQVSAAATPNGLAIPVTMGSPSAASVAQAAPDGLAVPVAVGSPTVSQDGAPQTVAPTGLAVPVTLGSPAAEVLAAAQPTGLAVSVALGSPSASFTAAASPAGLAVPVLIGVPTVGQAGQTITRPDTGTIASPSTGTVVRASTGTVTRPATGTVTRPDTGTITRP